MFRGGSHTDLVAIEELHRKDMVAARDGDVEALLSLWTEDGVAMPPGRPTVRGKASIRMMIEGDLAQLAGLEVVEYVIDFEKVDIFDDRAVEYGTYRGKYRSKQDGTTGQASGRLMRVLEREPDGTWRIARAIWNEYEQPASRAMEGAPAAQQGDAAAGVSRRR